MNYRHIYHAGSFADIFKHSVLTLLLSYLHQKEKPCTYIDSHAGLGLYDLRDKKTHLTEEAKRGILKLMSAEKHISDLDDYLGIVKKYLLPEYPIYPGSPFFMKEFQREQDTIILNELHNEDYEDLKHNLRRSERIHIHHRDAYEFLPAVLPPITKRGLILIDPPFEKTTELADFQVAIEKCLKRFETGIYMLWYPLINTQTKSNILQVMRKLPQNTLKCEVIINDLSEDSRGLNGCGVIIINPPYKINIPIRRIANYISGEFS